MQMTQSEIRTIYRDAKDKRTIITILSELNVCDKTIICDIVKDLIELTTPVKERKKKFVGIDKNRIAELHAMGYNDKEISLRMDVNHGSISHWRKKMGLPANYVRQGRFWQIEQGG